VSGKCWRHITLYKLLKSVDNMVCHRAGLLLEAEQSGSLCRQ